MTDSSTPQRLPTLFIPHGGGPCFFMDWSPADTWTKMAEFLRGLAATLPVKPKAILIVSGHWDTPGFMVGGAEKPEPIYDYSGFPEHTYHLRYDAPGSPALADGVVTLLAGAGIDAARDDSRGFDHGIFIPLKLVYPDGDFRGAAVGAQGSGPGRGV